MAVFCHSFSGFRGDWVIQKGAGLGWIGNLRVDGLVIVQSCLIRLPDRRCCSRRVLERERRMGDVVRLGKGDSRGDGFAYVVVLVTLNIGTCWNVLMAGLETGACRRP